MELPDSFSVLTNLEKLYFESNEIELCCPDLTTLTKLKVLNLKNNAGLPDHIANDCWTLNDTQNLLKKIYVHFGQPFELSWTDQGK